MASLYKKHGRDAWMIRASINGKKVEFYAGKVTKRVGNQIRVNIEDILSRKLSGVAPTPELSKWLATITGTKLPDQLIKHGLAEAVSTEVNPTIIATMEAMLETKTLAKSTLQSWSSFSDRISTFFGKGKTVKDTTAADCERFRNWMRKSGLSEAFIRKETQRLSQTFNWAIKDEIISRNPVKGLPQGNVANESRRYFVDEPTYLKIRQHAEDDQTDLLLVLLRIQMMRVHEALLVEWSDVNLKTRELTIRSSKTGTRICPVFKPLLELLNAVPKAERKGRLCHRWRINGRGAAGHAVNRAVISSGVEKYPRLLHNLRSSRITELLTKGLPVKDVASFAGQDPAILWKHYAATQKDSFNKALDM